MAEYISREAVLQKFLERGSGYINELTMMDMINEIPATDVQPCEAWLLESFNDVRRNRLGLIVHMRSRCSM